MAICHHLKILSSIPLVNDVPLIFKNMPVLFTSTKNYSTSKTLFDHAIYKIDGDDADELFHSKDSCTNRDCRIGEYCFCEAIKVDLAELEDKGRTNHFQKKKNRHSRTLSSATCLLRTLFEDLGCAIELHEKIANRVTVINEASIDGKEYLQLYESWCLFAYREFYKILLVILDEVSLHTFGEETNIQNRFCKLFDLHDNEKNTCISDEAIQQNSF